MLTTESNDESRINIIYIVECEKWTNQHDTRNRTHGLRELMESREVI